MDILTLMCGNKETATFTFLLCTLKALLLSMEYYYCIEMMRAEVNLASWSLINIASASQFMVTVLSLKLVIKIPPPALKGKIKIHRTK